MRLLLLKLAIVLLVAMIGASCSDDEPVAFPEIPGDEPADAGDAGDASSPPSTTSTTSTSTTSTTSTSTTTSTTTTTLDPDTLIVAEQFPGVTFPAAELPTRAGSINNNRAPAETDTDRALIAAFVESPDDTTAYASAPLTIELRERLVASAARSVAANETLDLSGGLTVRPYVVEHEDPSLGVVWDCSIDGSVWRDQSTGEASEPFTGWPQVGAPGVEEGVGYLFELDGDAWLLSKVFTEHRACA